MVKTYYRGIILVLASESSLYNSFKQIYVKYILSNFLIKVYFVYAGTVQFDIKEHDLVYSDLKESVVQPHPAKKVIRALEHINNAHEYDFLIRTNLSTFWIFERLLKRLDTLPTLKTITGRLGYFKPEYVVGSGMIITKDLVDILLDNKDKVYLEHKGKYIPEDRILSEFFTNSCGANILNGEKFVCNIEQVTSSSMLTAVKEAPVHIDHFRVKNLNDRLLDIEVHNILLEKYYGIT